jgi:cytochrome c5
VSEQEHDALDRATPVELERGRARRNRRLVAGLLALLGGIAFWTKFVLAVPIDYAQIEDHFKYGSIGADVDNGLPYWIWQVMPRLCAEHLQKKGDGSSEGYEAFGFVTEPGHDRPVGFSKRHASGIDLVGLNCATCHVATVRRAPEAEPELVLGMPANQLDLLAYFEFLFDCVGDPAFSTANVLAQIDGVTSLGPVERLIYRSAVPRVREALLAQGGKLAPLRAERFHSGKGRIDTFNPYKALVFDFPEVGRAAPGASDFPSIWNQAVREGMRLHWDGNNDSLFERNISAALGAGVTPESVDLPRIERVASWLRRLPPPEGLPTEGAAAVAEGKAVYARECAGCHGVPERQWGGGRAGEVEPLARIGTDPSRLRSYTYGFASSQWTIGADHGWQFRHFRKTDGYANMPLDGLWARAPYLHNGSVPTLRDLLARPPEGTEGELSARAGELRRGGDARIERGVSEARARGERPLLFFRGDNVIDPVNVGFVADRAGEGRRRHELYDTTREGRHNGGHLYGVALPEPEKERLIAYLKTL